MNWNDLYPGNLMPTDEQIEQYIGTGVPLWQELKSYIEETYQAKPKITYSKCSGQPGWNIKYQKSGKSLCTLYPMEGFFIALVVVGAKEEAETEASLDTLSPYVQGLYKNSPFSCNGHWLMIHVTDKEVLEDVKNLMAIRVPPKVYEE